MLVTARYGEMRYVADFTCDVASIRRGHRCVLATDRGTELGEILVVGKEKPMEPRPRAEGERRSDYDRPGITGTVLRLATNDDLESAKKLRAKEEVEEYDFCAKKIADLKLPMQLICAEHLLGGEKVVFYFLADERVDFRDLVKELSGQFRARIELRQVGVRDSARLVGDYNSCGQQLCCQTFIKDFEPITMKMAKTQRTTLDPEKISGRCGKLKCCLKYENDVYIELKKLLPNIGAKVRTKKGNGEVVDQHVIAQEFTLQLETLEWIKCWGSDVLEIVTPGSNDAAPKRRPRLPPPGMDDRSGKPAERPRPGARPSPGAGVPPAEKGPVTAVQSAPPRSAGDATAASVEPPVETPRPVRTTGPGVASVLKPGEIDPAALSAELDRMPDVPAKPAPPPPIPSRPDRPPQQGGRPPDRQGRPGGDRGGPRERFERRDRGPRPPHPQGSRPPQSGPRYQWPPPPAAAVTPPPAGSAPAGTPVAPPPPGAPPLPGAPPQTPGGIRDRGRRRRRGGRNRHRGDRPRPQGGLPPGGPPPAGPNSPPPPAPPPPPPPTA